MANIHDQQETEVCHSQSQCDTSFAIEGYKNSKSTTFKNLSLMTMHICSIAFHQTSQKISICA